MNWTSGKPVEGVKCIVETEGCVFPAHCINGTWWNTEKGFVIEGVRRWIVYPEGEEPNDYIPPEVLLKHLMKAYRENRDRLDTTRDLNRKLCSTYAKTKEENNKLKETNRKMKSELKESREKSQKLQSMFDRLGKLFHKAALFGSVEENQNEEEFVS